MFKRLMWIDFSETYSLNQSSNLVTAVEGSLIAWIDVAPINWPAQAKFLFKEQKIKDNCGFGTFFIYAYVRSYLQ